MKIIVIGLSLLTPLLGQPQTAWAGDSTMRDRERNPVDLRDSRYHQEKRAALRAMKKKKPGSEPHAEASAHPAPEAQVESD